MKLYMCNSATSLQPHMKTSFTDSILISLNAVKYNYKYFAIDQEQIFFSKKDAYDPQKL